MAQQVAVPDVFPAKVGHHVGGLGHRWYAYRWRYGQEVHRGTGRSRHVQQPVALGYLEGEHGSRRAYRHNNVFERVRPDGFPPAQLVLVGRLYVVGLVNPVDHLQVEQVEVHGMGVNA